MPLPPHLFAISAASPTCQFVLCAVLPQCKRPTLLFRFEIGDWVSLVPSDVNGMSEGVTKYAVRYRLVSSPHSIDTAGNTRKVVAIGRTGVPVLQRQRQYPPCPSPCYGRFYQSACQVRKALCLVHACNAILATLEQTNAEPSRTLFSRTG